VSTRTANVEGVSLLSRRSLNAGSSVGDRRDQIQTDPSSADSELCHGLNSPAANAKIHASQEAAEKPVSSSSPASRQGLHIEPTLKTGCS
jgi:hypothetical protein